MIARLRPRQFAKREPRGLHRERALVHPPDLALGAGDRHHGATLQRLLGAVGADHGRNAELAGDDRGVTGSPAALGHDRGRDLHHRLPIRRGRFGHQHLAGLEVAELTRAGNEAHRPARDLLADRAAGGQHLAAGAERVGLQCRRRGTPRHHGLRPRLDDVEFSVGGVLGPFDVHRHRVTGHARIMVLDLDRVGREFQHLGIGEAEAAALRLRHLQIRRAAAAGVDHAQLLAAERAAENGAIAGAESRLVHVELVGIDGPLHDILAEPVHPGNEHDVAETRLGVQREHHAARGAVGPHHLHHADGEADLEVIEAVVDAIGNRAVGEDRGEAAAAGVEQCIGAAHVEKAVVLPGKARRG